MANAFLWGLLAASSLVLGGLLASWLPLGKRTLGIIMGFGAGVLLSATAYELVFEAVSLAKGSGMPTLGFLAGAFTFFFSDKLIGRMGSEDRETAGAAGSSKLFVPLVLGIILDGVPESVVIGLGVRETGTVSLAMLVAVFISNLPEAAASTTSMRSSGWSRTKILLLWVAIALVCALASAAGYALLGDASPFGLSIVQAFAGGAILMMLANTMIPEAYEHAGKLAGVFTVLGFAAAVWVVVLEHAGAG
ncbi:MAG: ZIP family metal transporter [Deltaproteobacteria bacterium]|nr:ZIP family metal transporter [Deltaproteobacteria bacterium]